MATATRGTPATTRPAPPPTRAASSQLSTPTLIAEALGVSVKTVKQWAYRGFIEPVEYGQYDSAVAAEVKHERTPATERRRLARLAEQL